MKAIGEFLLGGSLAAVVLASAACNAITGLDRNYQELDCYPLAHCEDGAVDASADGSADASTDALTDSPFDGRAPSEGSLDQSSESALESAVDVMAPVDAVAPVEGMAPVEAMAPAEAGPDGDAERSVDAGPDGDAGAPNVESGICSQGSSPACQGCDAGTGQSCGHCGGSVTCAGTCSTPDPTGYGTSCGHCGGSVTCNGACSVATPPTWGQTCGSCNGTVQCDGSCGPCACPTGQMACGGACVNLQGNDGNNCGACGHSCLAGSCSNGVCQPGVVTKFGRAGVEKIVLDETNVYFCALAWINSTPKGGGPVLSIDESPQGTPVHGLAIDANNVYWADSAGSILRNQKTGNAPAVTLYKYANGSSCTGGTMAPFDVGIQGSVVYWSAQGGCSALPTTPAKLGGQVNTDGSNVVLYEPMIGEFYAAPEQVAADGAGVYMMTDSRGILPLPFGRGNWLTGGTFGLALDANFIYWSGTYTGAGSVGRSARDGSNSKVLLNNLGNPMGIAVDGVNIYWVDNSAGTVMSLPLGGGASKTLVSGQNKPWGIALDGTGIYWSNNGDGTIMVLAR